MLPFDVPAELRQRAALGQAWTEWLDERARALALGRWQGNGAALMLRADPRRSALLLERLHPEDLTPLWDAEACEIVAGLYRRRLRFHTVVEVAGLDEDRARDWVVVRALHDASGTMHDAMRRGRPLSRDDLRWITRMVTVAKAVQD